MFDLLLFFLNLPCPGADALGYVLTSWAPDGSFVCEVGR